MNDSSRLAIKDMVLTESDKPVESGEYREKILTAHTAIIGMMWRVLESYGIDPTDVIQASIYRPGAHISDSSYIRLQDYYKILGHGIRLIDDEAMGITAARLMHPSHLGVFGHAWLASPTILTSCRMLERFGRVFFGDMRVMLDETPGAVELSYDPHSVSPFPDVDADAQLGGFINFCRLQYGESFTPSFVSLRRKEPRQRSIWDEYFGVTVEFGAAGNVTRFDALTANEILTTAHTALFDQHIKALEKSSVEQDESNLIAHVRLAIEQLLPAGAVQEEKVAGIVDLNSRTLHRRLSEDDQSFRSLLKDVRMTLAERHLNEDHYNLTDIAFMLGYSDSSAFSRAFKSWFDVTPSDFRESKTVGTAKPN